MITLLLVLSSCSRVTQPPAAQYESKRMRHGVIPLNPVSREKLDQSSIDRGEKLYKQHCVSCHGISGEGDGPLAPKGITNLRKLVAEVGNFTFFLSVSQWDGDMPGWKEPFNLAQREDLASYIKTLR
jgi:mono/diheme cytochrome c family protein